MVLSAPTVFYLFREQAAYVLFHLVVFFLIHYYQLYTFNFKVSRSSYFKKFMKALRSIFRTAHSRWYKSFCENDFLLFGEKYCSTFTPVCISKDFFFVNFLKIFRIFECFVFFNNLMLRPAVLWRKKQSVLSTTISKNFFPCAKFPPTYPVFFG